MECRTANPADADVLARIHVDSWRAAYRGLVPDAFLARLDYARRTAQFRQWLAEDTSTTAVVEQDGTILGFVTLAACRDTDADQATTGEIWGIYLAPEHWRKGAGTALCRHAEALLSSQGYTIVTLWVFAANAAARRFYEAMGFEADGRESETHAGAPLKVVRYRKKLSPGTRTPRIPQLDGDWIPVASNPELPEIHSAPGEVVDHCFFRARNGCWQLWTQIRGTSIGRLFYRWEGGDVLEMPDWTPRGICWRAERDCGESWGTGDDEFIHAPHVLLHGDRFVLYYGGGPSETGHSQICAAVSDDGVHFRRLTDNRNQSQLFSGPGVARDPMVVNTGKRCVMYYAANEGERGIIAVRTASQPSGAPWSDYRVASESGVCGDLSWTQQCPFVVHLDGYFYLFKIGPSDGFKTAVYRSDDPLFFGVGDERLIAVLETSVSEVIQEADRFYISSLIRGYKGVAIRRLRWGPGD